MMLTCNRLDLETLGSRPIMPINLHGHWCMATLIVYKNGHQIHMHEVVMKLDRECSTHRHYYSRYNISILDHGEDL